MKTKNKKLFWKKWIEIFPNLQGHGVITQKGFGIILPCRTLVRTPQLEYKMPSQGLTIGIFCLQVWHMYPWESVQTYLMKLNEWWTSIHPSFLACWLHNYNVCFFPGYSESPQLHLCSGTTLYMHSRWWLKFFNWPESRVQKNLHSITVNRLLCPICPIWSSSK